MFNKKLMMVVSEKKKRVELCNSLFMYLRKGDYFEFLSEKDTSNIVLDLEYKEYLQEQGLSPPCSDA